MAGVDFGAWLARKYAILQQNADTNAAEVAQRDRAATMQYGVGGVHDRSEAASTKRKQLELEQDSYKFDKSFPLQEKETKAKVGLWGAQAGNLHSETSYNTAMLPYYTRAQEIENEARQRGLEGSRSFEDLNVPKPDFALPRDTYLSTDTGDGTTIDFSSWERDKKRKLQWGR